MGSDPFMEKYSMIILMLHAHSHSWKETELGFGPWVCPNYHTLVLSLEILKEATDSIYFMTSHYPLI